MQLDPTALAHARAIPDLTDPAHGPHAMQLAIDAARDALTARWRCGTRIVRADPVVAISDNYDALGIGPDAVARDERYARYVSETTMLRSHTSALIPPTLRNLATEPDPPDDVALVCAGMVYRRDAIDRIHTGTPHMVDLWRVCRREIGPDDLYDMIATVVGAVLPGARYRTEPRTHPYTQHGLQIDVRQGGGWVEVGECGIASPDVLVRHGLPGWHGLAMGIGLDRVVMLRKGIDDIRLLRSSDPRVTSQLADLAPYRPVSQHPAIVRDVSIAVDTGTTEDDLGAQVRELLGEAAPVVESVQLVEATPYDALPPAAVARLGIGPGQTNVLVRVVLRALDRTLTDAEANDLRDHLLSSLSTC